MYEVMKIAGVCLLQGAMTFKIYLRKEKEQAMIFYKIHDCTIYFGT